VRIGELAEGVTLTRGAHTVTLVLAGGAEDAALWGSVYRSPAGSTSPTFFSLVTTDRGDVAELCDANGAAFCAYRYDAWGLPQGAGTYATGIWTQSTSLITSTLAGEIASRQVLRYASYAWDAESALYYCSARSYDPATRQWTTGDPAKADGEESADQYCGGPVGGVDPSGQASRVFRWPDSGMSHNASTSYLKYVLKSNAGWLHYKYGLNRVGALLKIRAMSGDGDPWDFKASYKDAVTSTWLGGPVGCQTYSHTIYYGSPPAGDRGVMRRTTPPTGAATSRPRTSATSTSATW